MSEGMNRWQGMGNLGADPELRFTAGGSAVLNLRMGCTTSWFDKEKNERQERTEWVNVVVWGARAEALAKILVKGSQVFVEGELRTSSYEDKDKQKRYKTECIASNVLLCGSRGSDGASPGGQRGGGKPREQRQRAQPSGKPAPQTTGDYGAPEDEQPYAD